MDALTPGADVQGAHIPGALMPGALAAGAHMSGVLTAPNRLDVSSASN